jgi:hypothetical protein
MADEEINLEVSMIETLEKADISDELLELADAGVQQLVKMEGALSEIPYIRGLYSTYKAMGAFRDTQLIKKILHFLRESNKISDTDRANMWWDLQNDNEQRIRVGEHIIALLDKSENVEKADYLGRLFKYYTLGKINSSEFLRMSMVVTNLISHDLKQLPSYIAEQQGKYYSPALHSMGLLVRTKGFDNRGKDVEDDAYEISALGRKLVELLEFEYPK